MSRHNGNSKVHIGKLLGIISEGLGVLIQEGTEGNQLAFTFDKIVDYGGEEPKELTQFSKRGLRKDVLIKFEMSQEEHPRVIKVMPLVFKDA